MTNPYRPGSEDWHYYNLTKGAVGHVDSISEDDRGLTVAGTYYDPEALQMANMRVEKPSDVPWELRHSPSVEFLMSFDATQFTEAFTKAQKNLEKLTRSLNKAAFQWSLFGSSVRLSRWQRIKWWFGR